jgi:hypothetical protein
LIIFLSPPAALLVKQYSLQRITVQAGKTDDVEKTGEINAAAEGNSAVASPHASKDEKREDV